jgi:hypothetical protein
MPQSNPQSICITEMEQRLFQPLDFQRANNFGEYWLHPGAHFLSTGDYFDGMCYPSRKKLPETPFLQVRMGLGSNLNTRSGKSLNARYSLSIEQPKSTGT